MRRSLPPRRTGPITTTSGTPSTLRQARPARPPVRDRVAGRRHARNPCRPPLGDSAEDGKPTRIQLFRRGPTRRLDAHLER